MKKLYYAHFMKTYNTSVEDNDMKLLKKLFPDYEIVNPNTPVFQNKCTKMRDEGKTSGDVMQMFTDFVKTCSLVAFRDCGNGRVGAGVAKEVLTARKAGIPVIQIPAENLDIMSVEETRALINS